MGAAVRLGEPESGLAVLLAQSAVDESDDLVVGQRASRGLFQQPDKSGSLQRRESADSLRLGDDAGESIAEHGAF